MKPVFQTIFDRDGGNCFTASLASILELDIEAVPNFVKDHGDGWEKAAGAWLAGRGKRMLKVGFADYNAFLWAHWGSYGEHCILSLASNFENRAHAVVGRVKESGGIEIVHDPLPGNKQYLEGHRWVSFIVSI